MLFRGSGKGEIGSASGFECGAEPALLYVVAESDSNRGGPRTSSRLLEFRAWQVHAVHGVTHALGSLAMFLHEAKVEHGLH